ncbi:MAG: hypothetical protein KF873_01655 [Gemmataceae bacterium]|nr:hypothetical protein [Planctomycetia bacterium]MBX3397421.1 hypothetical protein [Gemmataceae bacterium]
MNRKLPFFLIAAGVLAAAGLSFGSKPDKEKEKEKSDKVERKDVPQKFKFVTKQELMAAKLKGSQSILEHIALNDFPKLEATAEDLVQIAKAVAFLNSYKGKEYEFHISTFRRAAETLGTKAKERNMDGVVVAFNDMTLSCLKCHNGIRDKKFEARLPLVGSDRVATE